MEKRKKLIAFFKELGFEFDIARFDDRLIAQKLVCLLELKGIDLGYSCSLYVRGPYSPDLTQDLYAFTREFETLKTGSRLTAEEKETAGELSRIFGLRRRRSMRCPVTGFSTMSGVIGTGALASVSHELASGSNAYQPV